MGTRLFYLKRLSLSLGVVFLLMLPYYASPSAICGEPKPPQALSLTLKDAIATAFTNNKDIQMQEQEVIVAQAGILGARSLFLPNISANAGFTHNDAVLNPSLGLSHAKKDLGIFTGYISDNKAGFSIAQTIYNGGANTAAFNQAKIGLTVQQETLRAKKLDVEFETKRLYYGLLLAYETQRIAQALVDQATSHYEEVKNKFKEGTSSRFDLLQSKVQVSKVTPELVRAKNAADLIAAELKKLLGLKMQDSLTLLDKLAYSLTEVKEEEVLKQAYLSKPEMVLKSLGIDLSKWAIQMARAGYRPQVSAGLNYNLRSNDPGDMFNKKHSNWDVGAVVSIPLFDGFSSKAKVDEARARYAQASLDKENLGEQIAVDIRKACLDLHEAEALIDSQKDSVEEAKEALRIANFSYEFGEGTNLDILDAQVSLSQIEKNLSEGVYSYVMAEAFLDRTIGKGFIQEAQNEKKD